MKIILLITADESSYFSRDKSHKLTFGSLTSKVLQTVLMHVVKVDLHTKGGS